MRIKHKIKQEHLLSIIANTSKRPNKRVEPVAENLDAEKVDALNEWLNFFNDKTITDETKISRVDEFSSLFSNYNVRVIDYAGPIRLTNIDEYIHVLLTTSNSDFVYSCTVQNYTLDEEGKINSLFVNSTIL